ncbi:MAG TPA: hypothetical protein VEC99_08585, partial [Clostridia bacterium]|nr:hypothetical protein [Clostridia bacterium]
LWYQLYTDGQLTDQYSSAPVFSGPPPVPKGGDAQKLCRVFGSDNIESVENSLRKPAFTEGGYTYALDRHADLVRALGISSFAVGTSYSDIEDGKLPKGLTEADILRVT